MKETPVVFIYPARRGSKGPAVSARVGSRKARKRRERLAQTKDPPYTPNPRGPQRPCLKGESAVTHATLVHPSHYRPQGAPGTVGEWFVSRGSVKTLLICADSPAIPMAAP
jgi:hypothetical protein